MLSAKRKSNRYIQVYNFWFYPTRDQIHDLQHSIRECYCTVHSYFSIHFCDSMWSFEYPGRSKFLQFFFNIVCLYLYCHWRSNYKIWRVEGAINRFITNYKIWKVEGAINRFITNYKIWRVDGAINRFNSATFRATQSRI